MLSCKIVIVFEPAVYKFDNLLVDAFMDKTVSLKSGTLPPGYKINKSENVVVLNAYPLQSK